MRMKLDAIGKYSPHVEANIARICVLPPADPSTHMTQVNRVLDNFFITFPQLRENKYGNVELLLQAKTTPGTIISTYLWM